MVFHIFWILRLRGLREARYEVVVVVVAVVVAVVVVDDGDDDSDLLLCIFLIRSMPHRSLFCLFVVVVVVEYFKTTYTIQFSMRMIRG